ncbi:MAG: TetR/AcrR family transcriptional regulator [Sandaracinaceae bacterium]|nr:TetR family transcriptional regulator [Myxococcales bacterium]
MSEEDRIARKTRRQARKRARILEVAEEVLVEFGLPGFTVAAVAERADLSKPSVYYYFESREALLSALLADHFARETHALLDAVERAESGLGALEAMMRAFVAHHRDDYAGFRALQIWALSGDAPPDLMAQEVYPLSWKLMGELEAKLERDRADGALSADVEPRRLANVALMTVHGIVNVHAGMDAMGAGLRYELDGLLDEACANLVRGAKA